MLTDEEEVNLSNALFEIWETALHIIPGHYMVVKSKEFNKILETLYKNKERKAEL